MSNNKLLNFHFIPLKQAEQKPTLVFIHGLFGDMNNLGVIARAFSDNYSILMIDLRNHGKSFHAETMDYTLMAEDLIKVIKHLNLKKVILIGHSMGGKTAMMASALYPQIIEKLVVIDIAPVVYSNNGHDSIFNGLFAVKNAQPENRQQAKQTLANYISQEAVQQFMLKSFDSTSNDKFRFNLTALKNNYPNIMGWTELLFDKPTLFIKGGNSNYILPQYRNIILKQFPQATAFTINGTGHWIHAEKPQLVIKTIQKFIA
ncbi:esterase [Bisgaardia hudsonensis]|uniref:Esterase n=1 Tax=Bisgaardia hudsonensis TaxID=109472 RepID=A0A4V2SJ41_9PAST|nr:alpha/beta fold hydrolase [Bisgaardia hudsonensis]QLB13459.1 acyl-CoA esterase [Bisgaardia hudsonensis]TCP12868.1 esterase [Bisgaardia hudsonensis]